MNSRGFIPLALAVGFGIANGYVVFNPALQEREVEKMKKHQAMTGSDLGPNLIEIPVSRTEAQGYPDNGQQKDISSPPNVQSANTVPDKPRWWWP